MIQVSQLSKSYGGRQLFSDVSFTIGNGETVGLVGRNGSGKSTLFKIILGQEVSDEGNVAIPQGYKIGHLNQHISFSKPTLLEECVQALPPELEYEHYRAEKILFGLGFSQADLEKSPEQFSGGFQLRINLTKCLLQQPNLLLLDEPTNYLDIISLQWMRQFLKSFDGEAILITHDRDFMDAAVTHTMGLHRGQLRKMKGATGKYYEQLAQDEEIYEKTRANQQRKLEEMNRFVERFRAKASKATQAQSMIKKIEKLEVMTELEQEQVLGFSFNYQETAAKRLMEVENLSFGFDQFLFQDLKFEAKPGQRIAIVGQNGKGKTTLLNVLAGKLEGEGQKQGEVKLHPSTKVAYYQQTNRKDLNLDFTVYDEIAAANPDLDITAIRSICGAMMFSGDDASKKIKVLSGGEQGRVLLGKVLATSNNLLFLDEPSNHLDMESIEVMIDSIGAFAGGVVFVTHNEKMLRQLATALIVFNEGQAYYFNGTYQEFLQKGGWQNGGLQKGNDTPVEMTKTSAMKVSSKKTNGLDHSQSHKKSKPSKHQRAKIIQERSKALRPLKEKIELLEAEIIGFESDLEEKNQLVHEALRKNSQGSEISDLYQEIGRIQISIEEKFSQLSELTSDLEQKETMFNRQLEGQ